MCGRVKTRERERERERVKKSWTHTYCVHDPTKDGSLRTVPIFKTKLEVHPNLRGVPVLRMEEKKTQQEFETVEVCSCKFTYD